MPNDVMVWDLETVPDLQGFAKANSLIGKPPSEIRAAMGDDFPKLIYHSIVCIGALIASWTSSGWEVRAIAAQQVGEKTEKQLVESFIGIVDKLSPRLVTFNGSGFDLPVLRYRAMIHNLSAAGMHDRAYFHRYTDDNVDLCDVLSSFSFGGKAKLDELCRIMELPGKPDGIDGSQVEAYFNAGRIQEIADYCKSDLVNTYRLWLRYELFKGKLDQQQFGCSDRDAASLHTDMNT